MKHSYTVGCDCGRCTRELARRTAQSFTEAQRHPKPVRRPRARRSTRKPTWGSQEWAETRGDDLPDDFDR